MEVAKKVDNDTLLDHARSLVVELESGNVAAAEKAIEESPSAAVVQKGTAFRQIEFVGILRGTKRADMARKLVDFMLERTFEEDIPLQMFVFPANKTAALPVKLMGHDTFMFAPVPSLKIPIQRG